VPFDRIASVTSLALLFSKSLGSSGSPVDGKAEGSPMGIAPYVERFDRSRLRMRVKVSFPFKQTRCSDAASSTARNA
jgi:hypothetical protein